MLLPMMLSRPALIGALLFLISPLWGAKVIMKDGKIYEGRIVAETDGDVLMRTKLDNRRKLLPADEILSVVRDTATVVEDPQRYASIETSVFGFVSDSTNVELRPAAGLSFAGHLRAHPLVDVGGGLDWIPALSGALAVTDGTVTREYHRFYSWSGGFSGRLFPFYLYHWKIEPFVSAGYHWSKLVPKGSGDSLSGQGLEGGAGAQWPVCKHLFLVAQLIYRRVSLDSIDFHGAQGGLTSPALMGGFSFSTGVAYHW
jgi:hypothetical protein